MAVATLTLSCLIAGPSSAGAPAANVLGDTSELTSTVCGVPTEVLRRIANGTRLDRSGEIQLVSDDPNFVSGGLSHASPFDYTQEVPMLWYGPGYIRSGVSARPVTLADIASTEAALLDFRLDTPNGSVLRSALLPATQRPLPKLLVTLVWDAAGRNVLGEWPRDWPYLKSLIADGAWFENATVGASPSNTPPAHAIIGTGAYPSVTGLVDEYVSFGHTIQKPFDAGPGALAVPTFGDLYDRAMGNRPVVGTIATLDPHVAMMSHGSMWGGGDKDIAVTRQLEGSVKGGAEGLSWNLTESMAPFYRLPSYVNEIPGFSQDVATLDRADGSLDGRWRKNDIAQMNNGFDTPARTPYQTRLVEEIVRREGFGRDATPDLLNLNYKAIDTVGHIFSLNSLEMKDAIRAQDENLRALVSFLDRQVGEGEWAMVMLADHGHQFDPAVSGAFEIGIDQLENAITGAFDDNDAVALVEWVRPTEIWLDTSELSRNGYDLTEVSRFIMQLTRAETNKPGTPVPAGRANDRVFEAAFPSAMLQDLPCLEGAA